MLAPLFWIAAGLTAFTHFGYASVLWLLRAAGIGGPRRNAIPDPARELPGVSLIIAAYDEEAVIAEKVSNALALDYPRERLEIIVASDGSTDATVERAKEAGADQVLDLPRGGKSRAQNAAAEQARGEILAFSDANSMWRTDALRKLVAAFGDPDVGYACGQVHFTNDDPEGDNQEGIYWRYEMTVRQMESDLAGITAGNGAIYAVRSTDYIPLGPAGSHDLSFPFLLAKRGRTSVYVPEAQATERMVPTLEGEWSRKRRMMVGIWDITVGEGMISPRGYGPLYSFQIFSHRLLRYLTPLLHLVALLANLALLRRSPVYRWTFVAQTALLAAAALAPRLPLAPFRLARYYVLTTAAIAFGLWDRLRPGGASGVGTWEKSDGTR